MSINLELSELERRTLMSALEVYRRIKGAEMKLTMHKEKTREDMARVETRYQTLLVACETLQTRLTSART